MHTTLSERPVAQAPHFRRRGRPVLTGVALGVVAVALVGVGLFVSLRTRGAPAGIIDAPAEGAVLPATAVVSGWAIDEAARANTGVDRVQLYVDGTYVGDAAYGLGRTDIGSSLGLQFGASGWSVEIDPQGLSAGPHTLEARAHSIITGQDASYTRTVVVPLGTAPDGAVDVPSDGAAIDGTTDVRGWAIDQRASDGTGIDRVQLLVDGNPLGDVAYGQSRPDVAASFGAQFDGSGWSAQLDPHRWTIGQHTLEARVRSALSGNETSYSRQFVVQQATAPRGAVDAPIEGMLVSGIVDVSGWALDENAREGAGVDRVRVYVDGEFVTDATYGTDRSEIGQAYGARFGPSGWVAQVDVGGRAAGPHTLEARARSALTGVETTYTRGFTVQP